MPADCSAKGPPENTVLTLGANGVLGLSVFREDCGAFCVTTAVAGVYYSCPATGCTPAAVPLANQLQNPAWRFPIDNNGIIVILNSVDVDGAARVAGALVFGIGTQGNNALGSATVLKVNSATGEFNTIYKNQTLSASFIDSGSNGYFFADSSLPQCTSAAATGFYCPASQQSLPAVLQSLTGVTASVNFNVANAEALLRNNATFAAFSNLAGTNPINGSFDWGAPFFYGRNVFVAIEGQGTAAGPGPFVAF